MRNRALAFLLFSLIAASASARVRAVRHPGAVPSPRSVMWIGAHPDDEAIAAPLLAHWCLEQGARCAMIVLTRGEAGPCLLPGGCVPDVATVRAAEAVAAAQYFGAHLTLMNLPDGGQWPDITDTVATYIDVVRPDLILTFDPRHGSTCHRDHRATANIVLDAVQRLPYVPHVQLLQTRVDVISDPAFGIRFSSATPNAVRFDASGAAWEAILEDMRRHPSQFDAQWLDAIRNVPAADRAVFIAPAETVLREPVRGCP